MDADGDDNICGLNMSGELSSSLCGLPGRRSALPSPAVPREMHLQDDARENIHQPRAASAKQSITYQTVRSAMAGRQGVFRRGEEKG